MGGKGLKPGPARVAMFRVVSGPPHSEHTTVGLVIFPHSLCRYSCGAPWPPSSHSQLRRDTRPRGGVGGGGPEAARSRQAGPMPEVFVLEAGGPGPARRPAHQAGGRRRGSGVTRRRGQLSTASVPAAHLRLSALVDSHELPSARHVRVERRSSTCPLLLVSRYTCVASSVSSAVRTPLVTGTQTAGKGTHA